MKIKSLKKEKVKRSRIILSAILTIVVALLSLGFGAYLGYVTLNINYVTIGTMTPMVGGLLVVAGFFIFFGCAGGMIAIKELFIAHRNEEKFIAYKGSLISAMVFYVITAIICLVGFIMSLVSYVPSQFTWTILALSVLTLILCASAFYLVLKEMKEHKKNKNQKENKNQENLIYNMNMSAEEIKKFKDLMKETKEYEINKKMQNINKNKENELKNDKNDYLNREKALDILYSKTNDLEQLKEKNDKQNKSLDFNYLSVNLKKLEELRKSGLINDQEYQTLKQSIIE